MTGTVLRGFEKMWRVTGDDRYFWYIKMTLDRVVTESGDIKGYHPSKYSLDDIQEAGMLLFLYTQTKEEKYRQAAVRVRQQLEGSLARRQVGSGTNASTQTRCGLMGFTWHNPFMPSTPRCSRSQRFSMMWFVNLTLSRGTCEVRGPGSTITAGTRRSKRSGRILAPGSPHACGRAPWVGT